MRQFTLLIPAYNEEKAIRSVIVDALELKNKINNYQTEIIVIDDGSSDNTVKIAKEFPIKIVQMGKNKGKGAALRSVIEDLPDEIIVGTIDADGTYPMEDFSNLLELMDKQNLDLVIGSRFLGMIEGGMPFLNLVGNIIFSKLISLLTGRNITDASSGMRIFKTKMFKDLGINANGLEFEVELTTASLSRGYRVKEYPIIYRERIGRSKLKPFKDGFTFFTTIISTIRRLRKK